MSNNQLLESQADTDSAAVYTHSSDLAPIVDNGATNRITPQVTQEADPKQFNILVVDNEELNIAVICGFLEIEGYQNLSSTGDPFQSLQIVESQSIDLVLLDVDLPNFDGLDVLKTIRNGKPPEALPIIVMTAHDDDETHVQALDQGATDFLCKPVNRIELTARVRNALSLKAHQDRIENYSARLEEAVKQRTVELEASRIEVIECLARAADFRDDDTGNHILRVGRYARIIGSELGLSPEFLRLLEPASQLHDVGKIGIPDEILLKPGKLTEDEYEYMKRHCSFGKRIISSTSEHPSDVVRKHASPVLQMASRIALTHHEKWDGTGYPLGLSGESIPIEGRITAVADVFDALSSKRPYKDPFPLSRCLEIMRESSGNHFDPRCIDAFFARVDEIVQAQIEFAETD